MKRVVAIICACILLVTTISISTSAEESKITVATANVISALGYDTCSIYFQDNVALMSVSDIERYTRAEHKLNGNTLTLSLGTRNISIDISSGKLTEDSITATIKTVKYNDTILLHAYPMLVYLGATCGVENEKLVINMPAITMWESLVRETDKENYINLRSFGSGLNIGLILYFNGLLEILESGVFEALATNSKKEAITLAMQVEPTKFNSVINYKSNLDNRYSALTESMIAATDFSSDYSDITLDTASVTKDLLFDYIRMIEKEDAEYILELDGADNLFTTVSVATTFFSNLSSNSKIAADTIDMVSAYLRNVTPINKYYKETAEVLAKTNEGSSILEAAWETVKAELPEIILDSAEYAGKATWEQLELSRQISVLVNKALFGSSQFEYATAQTACINLLILKNEIVEVMKKLSDKIIKENYSNVQNINDFRLLNIYYYRVTLAANQQFKIILDNSGKSGPEFDKAKKTMNEHNEYLADKIYKLSISKSFAFSDITKESKSNAFDNFKELLNKATIPTNNDGLAMYYLAIRNGQYTINNGYKYYTIQTGNDGMEPTGDLYKENITTGERKVLRKNTLAQLINVVNGTVFYTEYGNGPYNLGVHMISADGTYRKLSDDFILGLAADDKFVYYATDNTVTADGNSAIYRINYLTNTEKEPVVELNSRLDDLSILKDKIVYSEIPAIVNSDKRIIIYDINSKAKTAIPDLNIFEEMWTHANYIYILKWDKGGQLCGQGNKDNLDFLNRSLCRYDINKKNTEICQLPKADYEEIFNGYCVGDIYSNILDDIEKELPTNFNGSTKFLFE